MIFTLPAKTKTLWQIRIVLAIAFLCLFLALFINKYIMIVIFFIIATGLLFAFCYITFYFKSYKITIDTGFISISKGVFIKRTNIMPFPRLVYAQSYSTPLSSLFNMKILLLKAARSWLLIPELENNTAQLLLEAMRT